MPFEVAEIDKPLDGTGRTKLLTACEEQNVSFARQLLTSKADVDVANKDGQTPLYAACKSGCAELAQLLLYARASVSQATSAGYSPLYIASQKGHLDCCKMLMNARANVDQGAKNRSTPLLYARQWQPRQRAVWRDACRQRACERVIAHPFDARSCVWRAQHCI